MSLGAQVVTNVLATLGINVVERTHDELLAACPAHQDRIGRPDRHPSWWINVTTGRHICFSCGFKGNLEYLVAYVKGYTDDLDVRSFIGAPEVQIDAGGIRDRINRAVARNAQVPTALPSLPESRLALFVEPPAWARKARRLTREACARYGVLWDSLRDCWIIPIRNTDGSLMGWQEKSQAGPRYFSNYPKSMRKSRTFFGWQEQETSEWVILVESPLDAVRLASVDIDGGIASCGSLLSVQQYQLLCSRRVIAAFDNPKIDPAGAKASRDIYRKSGSHGIDLRFFAYRDTGKKDIGELICDDIHWGVTHARSKVWGPQSVYA